MFWDHQGRYITTGWLEITDDEESLIKETVKPHTPERDSQSIVWEGSPDVFPTPRIKILLHYMAKMHNAKSLEWYIIEPNIGGWNRR